jgi:arsenite oxidase large subunit
MRTRKVTDALDKGGSVDDRVTAVVAAVNDGGLFVVAQDIYPTESVRLAHVVFPAATQFELDMTSINGERRMRLYQKFMDPPGQAKPDWEIMALVAQRIQALYSAENNAEMAARFDGYAWKTSAEVFKDASAASAKSRLDVATDASASATLPQNSKPTFDPEDISFLDHEYILSLGNNGIQVPVNVVDGKRVGSTRLFVDGKFARPSGRAAFVPAAQPATPADVAAQKKKYKYLINNGRFNNMWQTGYESWRKPVVAERWGGRQGSFLELNVADAKELGISSGDIVRIHNDYADVTAVAYITKAVKPKQPFLLFAQPKKGTAGFLVTPNVDPRTNIPSYKLTYANIERVAAPPSAFVGVTFKDLEVPAGG